jgi:hypothetical protein
MNVRYRVELSQASEMLKQRPQLYADAKGKKLLPMLWGR